MEKGEKVRRYGPAPFYIKFTDRTKISKNPQTDNRYYRGFYISTTNNHKAIQNQPQEGFETRQKAKEYIDWMYKNKITAITKIQKR